MHRNFTSRFIRKIEKYDKSSRYETLRKSCEDVVAFIRDEGVRSKTEGVESQPLESRRLTKSIPRWVARQREERKRKRKREKERGRTGGDQPAHARGARSATDLYSGQLHHPHSRTHMHCAALEGEMSMEGRNERRRSSIFMKGCFRRMKTILAYIIPDARQKRGIYCCRFDHTRNKYNCK